MFKPTRKMEPFEILLTFNSIIIMLSGVILVFK